jgi:phosphate-selective porin OprO and OprP
MRRLALFASAVLLLAPPFAIAQRAPETKTSAYDRVWKAFTEVYVDDQNPAVQKVLFSGRYQHEFAALDSDHGDHSEWNVRRMRLGPKITFLKHYTLHAEVELNPQEHSPLYLRFTDFYVQWTRKANLVLTAGKHGVLFTMDGSTSSKELIAIDRSNLSNNIWFPQEYMPGVSASGKVGPWIYRGGLFSAGTANREFGEFDGGLFTLGVVGYDFAKTLGAKEALLAGNYVYQHPDRANTFTRQLEHVGSLNFKFERPRWGTRADLSAAAGYLGQPDLVGVMLMPFVNVTPKLQIVGRYTMLDSDGPNGVRLTTYESGIVGGRGDHYDEYYVGANYFFYGHKLKLQTGLQHAGLEDDANDGGAYSGWSWVSGLRVGW